MSNHISQEKLQLRPVSFYFFTISSDILITLNHTSTMFDSLIILIF